MLTLFFACTGDTSDSADTGKTTTEDTSDTGDSDSGTTDSSDTTTNATVEGLVVRMGEATADAASYDGWEELAFIADGGDGADYCRVRYTLTSSGARSDCADCLWAHDLVISEAAWVTEDICPDDFDPMMLDGTTRGYGYIPEYFGHAQVIAEDVGGTWTVTSFAIWDTDSHAFSYEIEDGLVTE